jgi:uncharacterized protein
MYSASVPIFTTMLGNLNHCLDKAQAYAETKKFDTAVLMSYRLAPDMLPFSRQILIEDTEATLPEFKARIQKTLDYLASVPADKINGTEGKEITFPAGPGKTRTMKGEAYLKHWALPNHFFPITTAYAILRHNGVDLGKVDYLMGAAENPPA